VRYYFAITQPKEDVMTPQQCVAARGALGWQIKDLAAESELTTKTIAHFESGKKTHKSTTNMLRHTFEKAGVRFDETGAGITWIVQ